MPSIPSGGRRLIGWKRKVVRLIKSDRKKEEGVPSFEELRPYLRQEGVRYVLCRFFHDLMHPESLSMIQLIVDIDAFKAEPTVELADRITTNYLGVVHEWKTGRVVSRGLYNLAHNPIFSSAVTQLILNMKSGKPLTDTAFDAVSKFVVDRLKRRYFGDETEGQSQVWQSRFSEPLMNAYHRANREMQVVESSRCDKKIAKAVESLKPDAAWKITPSLLETEMFTLAKTALCRPPGCGGSEDAQNGYYHAKSQQLVRLTLASSKPVVKTIGVVEKALDLLAEITAKMGKVTIWSCLVEKQLQEVHCQLLAGELIDRVGVAKIKPPLERVVVQILWGLPKKMDGKILMKSALAQLKEAKEVETDRQISERWKRICRWGGKHLRDDNASLFKIPIAVGDQWVEHDGTSAGLAKVLTDKIESALSSEGDGKGPGEKKSDLLKGLLAGTSPLAYHQIASGRLKTLCPSLIDSKEIETKHDSSGITYQIVVEPETENFGVIASSLYRVKRREEGDEIAQFQLSVELSLDGSGQLKKLIFTRSKVTFTNDSLDEKWKDKVIESLENLHEK
jgi:hypothetical protein